MPRISKGFVRRLIQMVVSEFSRGKGRGGSKKSPRRPRR